MDTTLTELRDALREYLESEVAAGAAASDASGELPPEWMKSLGRLGYLNFAQDSDAGPLGLSGECTVVLEIARVAAPLAVCAANTLVAARALEAAGPAHSPTADKLRSGLWSAAIGRLQTENAPGHRLVVGVPRCEVVVLHALTAAGDGTVRLLVGPDAKVEHVADYEGLRGLHAMSASVSGGVTLDAVASDRLLAADRILLSSVAAGIAQGALDRAVAYAKERTQFGRPIGAFGEMQALLARAWTRTVTAHQVALFAANRFDAAPASLADATHAFLHNTHAAGRTAERAQHVHGGYGHMREYQIGRYVRDAATLRALAGPHSALDRFLAAGLGLRASA